MRSFDTIAAWLHETVPARVRRAPMCVGYAAALGMLLTAAPAAADPRGVVELFTSQGCSSCPPADKILGEFAKDPSLIALSLPIDYWDYLGWKDTLADSRFSARQKAYSAMRGDRDVYTPQVVVNGVRHVLGSDRKGIEAALEQSHGQHGIMSVPVKLSKDGHYLNVSVAASTAQHAEVWICAVSKSVPITISRGENSGHQIIYHNVVRNVLKVGDWNGAANTWSVPLENISRDGVDAVAAYVQDGSRDKPGPMLGAAYTSLGN